MMSDQVITNRFRRSRTSTARSQTNTKETTCSNLSKAQDALRIELEKNKITRKKVSGAQRRLEEQTQFEIKQEKKRKNCASIKPRKSS